MVGRAGTLSSPAVLESSLARFLGTSTLIPASWTYPRNSPDLGYLFPGTPQEPCEIQRDSQVCTLGVGIIWPSKRF